MGFHCRIADFRSIWWIHSFRNVGTHHGRALRLIVGKYLLLVGQKCAEALNHR